MMSSESGLAICFQNARMRFIKQGNKQTKMAFEKKNIKLFKG